jgi:hypothetical protein
VKPNVKLTIWQGQMDLPLLREIQYFFGGIGVIFIANDGKSASFEIRSFEELTNVIIPHFDKYPLLTQKRADFLLFKSAIELMRKKEHLTVEGLQKIVGIRASMNLGLSDALKENYPNITPEDRPLVINTEIADPN